VQKRTWKGRSSTGKLKARAAKAGVEGSVSSILAGTSLTTESHVHCFEAVAHSALARTESRGAHSRIDYPNLDTAWEKKHNIIAGNLRHETPRIAR